MNEITQIKAVRTLSAPESAPIPPTVGVSGAVSRYLASSYTVTPVGNPVGTWFDSVGTRPLSVTAGTPTLRQTGDRKYIDLGTSTSDIFQAPATYQPPMQFSMAISYGWTASPTANFAFFTTSAFSIYVNANGRIAGYGGAGAVVQEPTATAAGSHRIIMTVDFTNDLASLWVDGVSRFSGSAIGHPTSLARQISIRGNSTMHSTCTEAAVFDHLLTGTEVGIVDAALASRMP